MFLYSLIKINKIIKASKTQTKVPHHAVCDDDAGSRETIGNAAVDKEDRKKEQKEKGKLRDTKAWLVERDGVNAGKRIPIQYEETILGKDKGSQIMVDDKSVSGKHAKIKIINNSF